MKKEQILKKVLKKAIKNGWEVGEIFLERINEESKTYEILSPEFYWWIYEHDFAKAFWNTTSKVQISCPDNRFGCLVYHFKIVEDWPHYLQQMVLLTDDEKFKYLEKFL